MSFWSQYPLTGSENDSVLVSMFLFIVSCLIFIVVEPAEEGEIVEHATEHSNVVRACLECQHLPSEERCIRVRQVQADPVGKTLKGTVLTFASGDNVLPPKVSVAAAYKGVILTAV